MPPPPVEEDPLVDALSQTAFLVLGVLTRIGAEHDLSVTQMRLLGILRNRRRRMSAVADHLGLDRSSLTGLVTRAERRGLVRRLPGSGDGRSVEAELTVAGAELTGTVAAQIRVAMSEVTAALSATERRRLVVLLGRMVAPYAV